MNPQLTKEIRILLFPWLFCLLVVSASFSLSMLLDRGQQIQGYVIRDPIVTIVGVLAWLLGSASLAARTFSTDFQEGTLLLSLSQPVPRPRQWREKYKTLVPAVALLTGVYWILQMVRFYPESPVPWVDTALLGCLFVVIPSVCSAAFWAHVTRSAIGTLVFLIATQALLALIALEIWERLSMWTKPSFGTSILMFSIAVLYSAGFFVAGWKRFSKLEVIDPVRSEYEVVGAGRHIARIWSCNALRCKPAERLRNLFRKELNLHKWTFAVGLLFAVGVIAVWLFDLSAGQRINKTTMGWIRIMPLALYMPLVAALAGSLALCEEKSLGLHAWNLTTPVSIRTQFLVKLGVGFLILLVMGLLFPTGMAWLFELLPKMDQNELIPNWAILSSSLALLFVAGFWAATLLRNVVHAVLTAVLATFAMGLCVTLGIVLAMVRGEIWEGFFTVTTTLSFYGLLAAAIGPGVSILVSGVLLVAFLNFRRPGATIRRLYPQFSIGLVTVFCTTFLAINAKVSAHQRSPAAVLSAVVDCVRMDLRNQMQPNTQRIYTVEDFLQYRWRFPRHTRAKLRGHRIIVEAEPLPVTDDRIIPGQTRQGATQALVYHGGVIMTFQGGPPEFVPGWVKLRISVDPPFPDVTGFPYETQVGAKRP